jgi:hypothetical protein
VARSAAGRIRAVDVGRSTENEEECRRGELEATPAQFEAAVTEGSPTAPVAMRGAPAVVSVPFASVVQELLALGPRHAEPMSTGHRRLTDGIPSNQEGNPDIAISSRCPWCWTIPGGVSGACGG